MNYNLWNLASDVKDVVAEQGTMLYNEYIAWALWSGMMSCLTCVGILAIVYVVMCKKGPLSKDFDVDDPTCVFYTVAGGIVGFVCFAVMMAEAFTILNVIIAPHAYVLDKILTRL